MEMNYTFLSNCTGMNKLRNFVKPEEKKILKKQELTKPTVVVNINENNRQKVVCVSSQIKVFKVRKDTKSKFQIYKIKKRTRIKNINLWCSNFHLDLLVGFRYYLR